MLQLLEMRSGLRFVEDYVDGETSNCLEMLFGGGDPSFRRHAASLPLEHEPGSAFNYSSGTTNIVARIVGHVIVGGSGGDPQHRERLRTFRRARSPRRCDRPGCRRSDPARGWRDHARTKVSHDPDGGLGYGRHFWLWPAFPGSFASHGYEGQFIAVFPDRDLVLVHLGKTDIAHNLGLLMRLTRLAELLGGIGDGWGIHPDGQLELLGSGGERLERR